MTEQRTPTCFIAMPITTSQASEAIYADKDHWIHVMEYLFAPAIEAAGYEVVRPVAKGSSMIHADIVRNLENCDLVLCDLSSHNPNVFFELGVRTSLDKPIAIVRDEHTSIPFDLGVLNAHSYDSTLVAWTNEAQRAELTNHLLAADATCAGTNPLWRQYGLTVRAYPPAQPASPLDAKLDLVITQVDQLQARIAHSQVSRVAELPVANAMAAPIKYPSIAVGQNASLAERTRNFLEWVFEISQQDRIAIFGIPLLPLDSFVEVFTDTSFSEGAATAIRDVASKLGLTPIFRLNVGTADERSARHRAAVDALRQLQRSYSEQSGEPPSAV